MKGIIWYRDDCSKGIEQLKIMIDNYDKGFCKKNDITVSTILTACSCKDYTLDGNIVKKIENTKVRK